MAAAVSPPERTASRRAGARRNPARILDAARGVFAERGASASTEDVARQAGVAIGTVFRHFPTKDDLLVAVVKDLRARLTDDASVIVAEGDPATALFEFFTRMVERAAANKAVFDRLAATSQGALVAGWDHRLQERTLAIVFAGLRPVRQR